MTRSSRVAIAFSLLAGALYASGAAVSLDGIEYIFAFGDSYTASGYTPARGLLNVSAVGNTTSGGPNWLEYLATDARTATFNLAIEGSVTNTTIVDTLVPSYVDQVATFTQYFVPAPALVPWQPANTLFVIWVGINDIGFSYLQDLDFPGDLPAIMSSHNNNFASLYAKGARNFLILSIPPTQRTPLIRSFGAEAIGIFAKNVALYNAALISFVAAIPRFYADTSVVLFDTQPIFNTVLNNPTAYGFQDATTICPLYETVFNDPFISLPSCPWPMAEYVWRNAYHPTWPCHRLLATVITNFLAPNAPATATAIPSSSATTKVPATTIQTPSVTGAPPGAGDGNSSGVEGAVGAAWGLGVVALGMALLV